VTKRISFVALFLAAIALLTTNCGTSDYLETLALSSNGANAGGFYNLVGADGTLQLVVTANYHSGKMIDVTNNSTWNVGTVCCDQNGHQLPTYGANTVPINSTGLMTAIISLCTWTDAIETTGTGSSAPRPIETSLRSPSRLEWVRQRATIHLSAAVARRSLALNYTTLLLSSAALAGCTSHLGGAHRQSEPSIVILNGGEAELGGSPWVG
jgi:hypothetical protein